ncbi:MAG: DDE-type integrase/transposase/recombinase [Candidatus Nanoarchaeia archaeon]
MNKEEVRKEYFKLRNKGHSNNQCRKIIFSQFGYETTVRTLRRWTSRLNKTEWDLCDKSKRPKIIHYKINEDIEKRVISIRNKTGWSADKIKSRIDEVSASTIKRIISKNNLCRPSTRKRKRIKYIRWQREHPNSLWQIDHTDEQEKGYCYTLSVIDDCSRYSLALVQLKNITTEEVIKVLERLIKIHGKPREILTDNGNVYGLTSEASKFDIWCRRNGIKHIRSAIHSPTTTGKVERLFQTLDMEMPYCNNDFELFRMRYNHFRPHTSLHGKAPADIYFAFDKLF